MLSGIADINIQTDDLVKEGLVALFSPDNASSAAVEDFASMGTTKNDAGIPGYDALSNGLVTWRDAETLFRVYVLVSLALALEPG